MILLRDIRPYCIWTVLLAFAYAEYMFKVMAECI